MAPLMDAPFLYHWYERELVPVALTENVAVAGAVTVWLCGWVLNAGPFWASVGCERPTTSGSKTERSGGFIANSVPGHRPESPL